MGSGLQSSKSLIIKDNGNGGTEMYSISKAPDTIDAMLPFIEKASGIRFASAELLFSDPYAVLTKGLSSAVVVGSDTVQGVPCEHLAFRPQAQIGKSGSKAGPARFLGVW
jgi:hypothetical protein